MVHFMERHTRDVISAFGIEFTQTAITLHISEDECLERLIENMDEPRIGIHAIRMYTHHLKQVPNTHRIAIPRDGLDVRYINESIIQMISCQIRTEWISEASPPSE